MGLYTCIIYEKKDTAAVIRLNMPRTGNRIGLAAVNEIQDAMKNAWDDDEIKSIILTGTGEFFCAGGAIDGFPDGYAITAGRFSGAGKSRRDSSEMEWSISTIC